MALKGLIEGRMNHWGDTSLQELRAREVADRRNGYFPRHLLTELGDLELRIPRPRTCSALGILREVGGGLARRVGHVERMILLAFCLGLSPRKVERALLPILGEKISASTVSAGAKKLDEVV